MPVALPEVHVPLRLFRMAQPRQEIEERLRPEPLGQGEVCTRPRLTDRRQQLPPEHRHDDPCWEQKPVAHGLPLPVRGAPTAGHETVHMRMQHQGLAPGVERGDEARLRAAVLGVRQEGAQRVVDGLKQ